MQEVGRGWGRQSRRKQICTGVRVWRDKEWKIRTHTAEGTSGIGDSEAEDLPRGFWISGQKRS